MGGGGIPHRTPSLACLCMHKCTHVTPLLKILATGSSIVVVEFKVCMC